MMRIRSSGPGRPRRGATRRRPRRHLDWATFDRWLDRVVIVAVGVALVVGILALILSLLL